MAKKSAKTEDLNVTDLVGRIAADAGKLLGQQIELLTAEVREELRQAASAAGQMAAGGGLTAVAGIMSGMMLAHLLHRATGLPLWASYGAIAGGLGLTGTALLKSGGEKLASIQLMPPQTQEAVKENLTWLKDRLVPAVQ